MSVNYRETVSNPVTLTPSPKTMTLSGLTHGVTATSNQAVNVAASFGSMALSNLNAQIGSDVIARPGFGSMTLTGQVTSVDFVPVQGDVTVDASTDSMTLTGLGTFTSSSGPLEADWQQRISGPGVVWHHNFVSETEVDAFRWVNGLGNDPNDITRPNKCRHITTDGFSGGGCLELIYAVGSTDAPGWWRPFGPMSAADTGKAVDDPGANGTISLYSWDGLTDTNANANFREAYYAHPDVIGDGGFGASKFNGHEFWLQWRQKMDANRYLSGTPSEGKQSFLATTQQTLNQEIVQMNRSNRVAAWYTNFGSSPDTGGAMGEGSSKQPGGDYPSCDYSSGANCWTWNDDEWVTWLYHVIPGHDGVEDTLFEAYACRDGDTEYDLVFSDLTTVNFSSTTTGHPQGYNAFHPSNYMNGQSSSREWFQRYDEVIFSKQPIPVPQANQSVLKKHADSISEGQSINLLTASPSVPKSGITRPQYAWQSKFHYDPINNKCVVWGKEPGSTTGFHMRRYIVATNTWETIWGGINNSSGHIYGHNALDSSTGDSYFHLYQSDTAWRITADNTTISLPGHGYSYLGTYSDCSGWHPNLYGPGDGGYVHAFWDRIVAYRKSTNTWEVVTLRNMTSNQLGNMTYLADTDELVYVGRSDQVAYSITPNGGSTPIATVIADCPIEITAASTTESKALLEHPYDTGRLLALGAGGEVRQYDGTSWSDPGYNHPFVGAGGQGFTMCSLQWLGVIWRLDDDASVLWRPPS